MRFSKKTLLIGLSILALFAIILLAAGLNDINFSDGRYFQIGGQPEVQNIADLNEEFGIDDNPIIRLLFTALVILLPVGVILMAIWPEGRKMLLRVMIPLAAAAIIAPFLNRIGSFVSTEESGLELPTPNEELLEEAVSMVTIISEPPAWLVYLISFAFVAGALVILWFIYTRFIRSETPALEIIAREAQDALDDIRAGAEFKDTIIRCYYEMSAAISAERGIERKQAMTPREFEKRLSDQGLPIKHISQLTRLFESVRYGSKAPNPQDEDLAIASLTAIVQAASEAA